MKWTYNTSEFILTLNDCGDAYTHSGERERDDYYQADIAEIGKTNTLVNKSIAGLANCQVTTSQISQSKQKPFCRSV